VANWQFVQIMHPRSPIEIPFGMVVGLPAIVISF